jgi:glycerate kinase
MTAFVFFCMGVTLPAPGTEKRRKLYNESVERKSDNPGARMEKIMLAPDSYKGSLSAIEVCDVLASVISKHFPQCEIVKMPMSDGGEGFVNSIIQACGGKKVSSVVCDPLNRPINAAYGILDDGRVIIEMAAASGLMLVESTQRDVMTATSLGTGQLIKAALDSGFREFIIGIGGSATNDGGAGAASALGIRYLSRSGSVILNGGDLQFLDRIDTSGMDRRLLESKITIACDVTNPLVGELGAAQVFAPQKGASPAQVDTLDLGLRRLNEVLWRDTGINVQELPGSGAAGGFAAPFIAYAGARLQKGMDLILEVMDFDPQAKGCDLIITGEGRTDRQSAMGKVVSGIGKRAAALQIPAVVISGSLDEGYEELYEQGISAFLATTRRVTTLDDAMASARESLFQVGEDFCRILKLAEK